MVIAQVHEASQLGVKKKQYFATINETSQSITRCGV